MTAPTPPTDKPSSRPRPADLPKAAAELAVAARRLSADGQHRAAIAAQTRVVELCRQILDEYVADVEASSDIGHTAALKLADHHGRLGGIYRRADLLNRAVEHYREGADLEREWNLDVTYNRTNDLVVSVLLRPDDVPSLAPQIDEVAGIVRRQVKGPRRNEWWAWADLALLNLLAGRWNDALWAYHRLAGTGPRRQDYESALSVLLDVKVALAGVRWERSAALVGSVSAAVEYLRGRRDELTTRLGGHPAPTVWIRCVGPSVDRFTQMLTTTIGPDRVALDVLGDQDGQSELSRWAASGASVRVVVIGIPSESDPRSDPIVRDAEASGIPIIELDLSPDTDIRQAVRELVQKVPELLLPSVLQTRPSAPAALLDLVQRATEPDAHRLPPPSVLLRPEYRIVPFAGRSEELRLLTQWLDEPVAVALQLIAAPGGSGKTRLAHELVARAAGAGWTAGFLTEDADLTEISRHRSRLLLVVDYAEARTDQLTELLLARASGSEAMRVLLLARSPGLWLRRLREHPDERVRNPALLLGHLSLADSLGEGEYERACRAFSDRLNVPMPSLDESTATGLHGSPLDVHAAALMAVLASRDETPVSNAPMRQALHHERRYWTRTLAEHGLPDRSDAADQVVAMATLGGTAAPSALDRLLRRLPTIASGPPADVLRWRSWLIALYPAPTGFAGLQPDLLAEELIAEVVERVPETVPAIAGALDDQQFARAFAVFSRAANRRPAFGRAMSDLLAAAPVQAISIAMTVATRAETPIGPLIEALTGPLHDPLGPDGAPTLSPGDVNVVLATFAVARTRAALKRAVDVGDKASVAQLTHQLARRLAAAGNPRESLGRANEAARLYRELLDQDLAMRSELAAVLVTAAKAHEGLGRTTEGLAALDRAIEMAGDSDQWITTDALLVRGVLLGQEGDSAGALEAVREAVQVRRAALSSQASARDRMAAALEQYGGTLVAEGRVAEAISAFGEAVHLLRGLDAVEPSWFRSDLVRVLVALADAEEQAGLDTARRTSEEAISLGRSLLDRYGGRHSDPLLAALRYATAMQERIGNRAAAVTFRTEMEVVSRRLNDERPDVAAMARLEVLRSATDSEGLEASGDLREQTQVLVETLRRIVEAGRLDLASVHEEAIALLVRFDERAKQIGGPA